MNAAVFELGPDFKVHAIEGLVIVHHLETDVMVLVPRREILTRFTYLQDVRRRRDRPVDVLRYFVRRVLDDYQAGRMGRLA